LRKMKEKIPSPQRMRRTAKYTANAALVATHENLIGNVANKFNSALIVHMRLRNIRVKGFRCVRDSGQIAVKDIAALIGRNESGKTSILQSLILLNKDSAIVDVDMTDGLEAEMGGTGFRVVEGKFELAPEETRSISELGDGLPELKELTIYRMANSGQPAYDFGAVSFPPIFRFQAGHLADFKTKITAVLTPLRQKINVLGEAQKPTDMQEASPIKTPLIADLERIAQRLETLNGSERPGHEAVERLIADLELVKSGSETVSMSVAVNDLTTVAKNLYMQLDSRVEIEKLIQAKLHPRFVYFSSYKTIHGAIRLSEYLAAPGKALAEKLDSGESLDKRETIDNLFFLGGLDPKHLDTLKTKIAAKNKYLLQCSEKLTDEIQKSWVREDGTRVFCEFQYGDDVVTIRVSDIHGDGSQTNKQLLQRRSEGFKWHFSFQVNFRAETKKADLKEAILLLDEPGLHLHPAQQERLLSAIRELAKDNQVIYTTHSPFMIFNYEEGNLLLVETDPSTHLSRVNPAFWNGDPVAIIPILHSLGAKAMKRTIDVELARQLPPILVVEGGTDYQYIKAFNWLFRKQNSDGTKRVVLDFEMHPANSSSAIGPWAMFNRQVGHNVVVLFDNEPDAKKHAEELKKLKFPEEQIAFIDVAGKTECDIEDVFSEGFFLAAVNDVYRVILKSSKYTVIEKRDLLTFRQNNPSITRIVPILEKIWESHKADGWGKFDKVAVCEKICLDVLQSGKIEESFATAFQQLFERILKAAQAVKAASTPNAEVKPPTSTPTVAATAQPTKLQR
jgi:hypothetical protein